MLRNSDKAKRRDPWDEVLSRHVSSHEPDAEPAGGGKGFLGLTRRGVIALLSSTAVILVAAIATLGWVALENQERGQAWQQRSQALTNLVEDRTQALNRQTARLNTAAVRLRQARRAIRRSEADVKSLQQRQAELASEKAQVEDQRAFLEAEGEVLREQGQELEGVANLLLGCNSNMADVLGVVLDGFIPSDYSISALQSTCASATSGVSDYVGRYGSP